MSVSTGWVKLHRKILDNPYMQRPAYRTIWIEILLRAQHDNLKTTLFKGEKITLKQGQFTCGLNQLSKWTGVPRGTCERVVKCFKSENMIETETSSQFTIYSVVNWDMYQNGETLNENTDETLVRRQRDAGENTIRMKEDKECKEYKKDTIIKKEIKRKKFPEQVETAIEEFISYRKEKGKRFAMGTKAEELFRNKVEKALPSLGEQGIIQEIETSIEKGYLTILYNWKPPKAQTTLSDSEWEEMTRKHAERLYSKLENPITPIV